ncbi:arsenate reductase [Kordiimonas sediminis]|uniref:Arsenate reductase n=1 Tax=Kordiimonas sediminis TaxID=1735581 RepID=A0A919AXW2_9PROT|nr:arsenate reductase [Kordiimonas sediminis]
MDAEGTAYNYHDFRKDGLDLALVERMLAGVGADTLVNKRGTTWRKLTDEQKAAVETDQVASLLVANDALIKRPVWEKDGVFRTGFAAKDMDALQTWLKS